MDYVRVSIATTGEGIEPVIGALSTLGLEQLELIEDEAAIQGYLDQMAAQWDYVDPQELLNGAEPCVRVYIPAEEFKQGRARALDDIRARMEWLKQQDIGLDLGTLRVLEEAVREQDWANNWKKYYKPLRIGKSIVIKPTWENYDARADDVIVELDPGMAFGTGTHETTALCLEAIETRLRPGDRVLDIGCGSGILSIAAIRLGAESALAIDVDPVAVKAAGENVMRNGLEGKIVCTEGDLLADVEAGEADIVVANIVADVILRLMPAAYAHTRAGGTFIASGIIDEREKDVLVAAKETGFSHLQTLARGAWRAVVFGKG